MLTKLMEEIQRGMSDSSNDMLKELREYHKYRHIEFSLQIFVMFCGLPKIKPKESIDFYVLCCLGFL